MLTPNTPEQIQVFFEIAMSIGSSLDLKKMAKSTLMSYLRKLNCSSGAVLQLQQAETGRYYYSNIISIPYKSDFKEEFKDIIDILPSKATESDIKELIKKLPVKKNIDKGSNIYLMHLHEFGLLCLKRNGAELTNDVLFTLRSINEKFAQSCFACVKNNDLKKAKEKAIESDKLKSAFIENISHEIRTPLNAIIGYSSLIADKQISDKMLPQACKTIVTSSNNLVTLIEDLLDVSMLESGNFQLKYTLCNINQTLIDLEEIFRKHISIEQKYHLNMRISTPIDDVFFVSDLVRLNQIFDQLISNAIRFTDEGEIQIGYLANLPEEKPGLRASLTFYVKDNGIGIPKDKLNSIFNPFNRIDNTTDKMYRGTGIGLTITKRLVELLGGEIWVESEQDEGATVFFTVPTIKSVDELTSTL